MKWVLHRKGTYRYVEDSDERPEIKLQSKPIGVPYTTFTPSWRKFEEGMKNQVILNEAVRI